jgi:hypothetical protein
MSLARNTHAKYGAKIPTAPSTGAKQAKPAKQDAPVDPLAKPDKKAKKSADKKR